MKHLDIYDYPWNPIGICKQCKKEKWIFHQGLCYKCNEEKRRTHRGADFCGGNRKKILERDHYRCLFCKTKENLQVHHIDGRGAMNYKEEPNHSLNNLITLCKRCHRQIHNEMKRKNLGQAFGHR